MVPYKDGYARPSVREGCAGQARHTTSPANQEAVESLESWEPRAPLTLVLVAIATSDLQAQAQAQDAGAGIRCPIKCWYSSANSREPLSLCQRPPPLTADYDLLPSAYYLPPVPVPVPTYLLPTPHSARRSQAPETRSMSTPMGNVVPTHGSPPQSYLRRHWTLNEHP